jgi:hypothetical protein
MTAPSENKKETDFLIERAPTKDVDEPGYVPF